MESWKNWKETVKYDIESLQNHLMYKVITDTNAPQDEVEEAERIKAILWDALNTLRR